MDSLLQTIDIMQFQHRLEINHGVLTNMKINSNTDELIVVDKYMGEWVNVKLKTGKTVNLYIASVDNDFETPEALENAIYYNKTGSDRYADDGIPFSQIDSIELADPPEAKKHG